MNEDERILKKVEREEEASNRKIPNGFRQPKTSKHRRQRGR